MSILEQQVRHNYRLPVRRDTTMHKAAMGIGGLCSHAIGAQYADAIILYRPTKLYGAAGAMRRVYNGHLSL